MKPHPSSALLPAPPDFVADAEADLEPDADPDALPLPLILIPPELVGIPRAAVLTAEVVGIYKYQHVDGEIWHMRRL